MRFEKDDLIVKILFFKFLIFNLNRELDLFKMEIIIIFSYILCYFVQWNEITRKTVLMGNKSSINGELV